MIVVGAISSLSEMLNDFASRLDEDDSDTDSLDTCHSDSGSSQNGRSDSDSEENYEDDEDNDSSSNDLDDDASQLEDIQASFRILALDGFKVAVWDELCDGVLLHRTGAKRPKGDICLVGIVFFIFVFYPSPTRHSNRILYYPYTQAIIVCYALPDVLISTHLEHVARYLHFWRGKISIQHTVKHTIV